MLFTLRREIKLSDRTLGGLYLGEDWTNPLLWTLEDTDRGLNGNMSVRTVWSRKIQGKTAIPYDLYEVVMSWSNHFQKYLPQLFRYDEQTGKDEEVRGFTGVRCHGGNGPDDTEGCPLFGSQRNLTTNIVFNCPPAMKKFIDMIEPVLKTEKVFIRIIDGTATETV